MLCKESTGLEELQRGFDTGLCSFVFWQHDKEAEFSALLSIDGTLSNINRTTHFNMRVKQ